MKDFESITEKQLLYAAYYNLLDILLKEEDRNERYKMIYGNDNKITARRIDRLTRQTDEMHARILEIENAE